MIKENGTQQAERFHNPLINGNLPYEQLGKPKRNLALTGQEITFIFK